MAREVTEQSSLPSPTRTTRLQLRLQHERPNIFPSNGSSQNGNRTSPRTEGPEASPFNLRISSETFLLDANESFNAHMQGVDGLSDVTTTAETPVETLEGLRVSPRKNKGKSKGMNRAEQPLDEPASPIKFVFRPLKSRARAAPPPGTLEPETIPETNLTNDYDKANIDITGNERSTETTFPQSNEIPSPEQYVMNAPKPVPPAEEFATMTGAPEVPHPTPRPLPQGTSPSEQQPNGQEATSTDATVPSETTSRPAKLQPPRRIIQLRSSKSRRSTGQQSQVKERPEHIYETSATAPTSSTTYTVALRAPVVAGSTVSCADDSITPVPALRRSRSKKSMMNPQPVEADEPAQHPLLTTSLEQSQGEESATPTDRSEFPKSRCSQSSDRQTLLPQPKDKEALEAAMDEQEDGGSAPASTSRTPEQAEDNPVFDEEVISEAREAVSAPSKRNPSAELWVRLKDEDLAAAHRTAGAKPKTASTVKPPRSNANKNAKAGPSRPVAVVEPHTPAAEEPRSGDNGSAPLSVPEPAINEQAPPVEVIPPPRIAAHIPEGKVMRIVATSAQASSASAVPTTATAKPAGPKTGKGTIDANPPQKEPSNKNQANVTQPSTTATTAITTTLKRSRTVTMDVLPAPEQQPIDVEVEDSTKVKKRVKLDVELVSTNKKAKIGLRRVVSGTTATRRPATRGPSVSQGNRRVVSERQPRPRPVKAAVPVQSRSVSGITKAQDKDGQIVHSTVPHAFTFQSDRRLELKKEKVRGENAPPIVPLVFKVAHHPVNLSRPTQASLTRALATISGTTNTNPIPQPLSKPSTLSLANTAFKPTVPQELNLATATRMKERNAFDEAVRRKDEERQMAEEERRKEEEHKKDQEVKALRKLLDETAKANVHEAPEWYKDRPHLAGGRKGVV
ncbi:hypothetical protein FRB94_005519 [Tulasnella sp. JGI-2019a]|nr:hypothetical protein FRB94_005519 [Tulasnella sp. JGI-2019a]